MIKNKTISTSEFSLGKFKANVRNTKDVTGELLRAASEVFIHGVGSVQFEAEEYSFCLVMTKEKQYIIKEGDVPVLASIVVKSIYDVAQEVIADVERSMKAWTAIAENTVAIPADLWDYSLQHTQQIRAIQMYLKRWEEQPW